jgi:outer membrane protein assembly factor BamB
MHDSARSGIGPVSPIAKGAQLSWKAALDGDAYASPLVSGKAVIAATENNTVYALDPGNGNVRWHTHLGVAVPLSALACGNIDPNGITSTPVLDSQMGIVFVVAMLSGPLRHELFALSLSSGQVTWHRGVDPPGANPRFHQQRAALNLANGRVYIAYGGFTGDCGDYHGWVVAAPTSGAGNLLAWMVPSEVRGAIWSPAGPVISDIGDVWVSTGNTDAFNPPSDTYDNANAVIRVDGGLSAVLDQWAPRNWAALNRTDTDLGSLSPGLLPQGLVFISGKDGIGYLLRSARLGGIGGEAYRRPICNGGPAQGAYGGAAIASGMIFVPCKVGLTALRLNPSVPSLTSVWQNAAGSNSPVVAYGLVWTVSANPSGFRQVWNGKLVGMEPASGEIKASVELGPLPHFPSPAAVGGQLFVGGLHQLYAIRIN